MPLSQREIQTKSALLLANTLTKSNLQNDSKKQKLLASIEQINVGLFNELGKIKKIVDELQ